ncbi:LLM class flavin-dependent oxidoreductase, partial [Arthrobacter deserti]|nr:LLM class flavin-dependent oxidoreductase [Arthrobacter deserti]
SFGFVPGEGQTDADMAREHTSRFRAAIAGAGVARADPQMTGSAGMLAIQPQSPGLPGRIWWGSGTRRTARWAAEQGMNLMSSTLLSEDTGVPFGDLQAEQIAIYREAWQQAGWERQPQVTVSRSVIPITSSEDVMYFGNRQGEGDQVGYLEGVAARFGRTYTGEPDVLAEELAGDAAVQAADTVLLTVPNQLGVDYNARLLQTVAREIAPSFGWQPAAAQATPGQQPPR